MPLSTSSSRGPGPGPLPSGRGGLLAWALALVLVLVLLAGWELLWRGWGFAPSVEDNRELWAYHRSRVYQKGAVVLVGASAMAQDLDPALLSRLAGGRPVIQLAVAARAPMATLLDLCNDRRFTGAIIASLNPQYLGAKFFGQQGPYVRYYHQQWHWYLGPVVRLRAWLQERLVLLNNNFNVLFYEKATIGWLLRRRPPEPFYVTNRADRSQAAHYTPAINARRLAAWRAGRIQGGASLAQDPAYYDRWRQRLAIAAAAAARLRARGGRLAVVMLPLGGRYQGYFERRWPRRAFWDLVAARLGPPAIHWADYPSLAGFTAADGTHLDASQAAAFTRRLAAVLGRLGFWGSGAR